MALACDGATTLMNSGYKDGMIIEQEDYKRRKYGTGSFIERWLHALARCFRAVVRGQQSNRRHGASGKFVWRSEKGDWFSAGLLDIVYVTEEVCTCIYVQKYNVIY